MSNELERDLLKVLVTEEELKTRVAELGEALCRRFQGERPLFLGVLKGSFIFMADLVRACPVKSDVEFIAVSSYENATVSSGRIRINHDIQQDITGRHLIIVEDILDSGNTLASLRDYFLTKGAASITIVTLLDKPSRRTKAVNADLAGFVVGAVDKSRLFNRMHMRAGDVVLALPSSGVHSNGFSLVRKVLPDRSLYVEELGATLGEALLVPTKIYVKPVLALAERIEVKGASHITGGGFYENVPRCLPSGLSARIEKKAVRTPPIFDVIQKAGNVPERDMFNTFNMGVGMCLIVDKEDADTALSIVKDAYVLGELVKGDGGIELCE